MGILTVEYDKDNGIVAPDGKLEEQVNAFVDCFHNFGKKDKHVLIANSLMISYLRVLVKKGKLDYNDVMFKYKDTLIAVDKDGRLSYWPEGFDDMWDKYLNILVGWPD